MKGDYVGVAVRVVVGMGLAFVSLVKMNLDAEEVFLYRAWMLPTVMLGLGAVVLVDGVVGWVLPARSGGSDGGRKEEKREVERVVVV